MKIIFKILTIVPLVIYSGICDAQQKTGHVNANEVFSLMPESKVAMEELQKFSKVKETDIQKMESEYKDKYTEAVEKNKTLSEANKGVVGKELEEMSKELESFKQRIDLAVRKAQQEVSAKQKSLLEPVNLKFMTALKAVSKERNLAYVFGISNQEGGNALLIWDEGEDVTEAVKKKLGITPLK